MQGSVTEGYQSTSPLVTLLACLVHFVQAAQLNQYLPCLRETAQSLWRASLHVPFKIFQDYSCV